MTIGNLPKIMKQTGHECVILWLRALCRSRCIRCSFASCDNVSYVEPRGLPCSSYALGALSNQSSIKTNHLRPHSLALACAYSNYRCHLQEHSFSSRDRKGNISMADFAHFGVKRAQDKILHVPKSCQPQMEQGGCETTSVVCCEVQVWATGYSAPLVLGIVNSWHPALGLAPCLSASDEIFNKPATQKQKKDQNLSVKTGHVSSLSAKNFLSFCFIVRFMLSKPGREPMR